MSENEPTTDIARFAQGEMVDHFQVIRLLGRGGFGDVYLARDTKLGRKVALKVIHAHHVHSEEAARSFMFEARATARFSHPHIVTIYAVGEHAGVPYVALEYLPGRSLRDRLREGPLGLGEVLRIGLAVAEAVQEAHQSGILHRDLKPENILIPTDGRPRVVDFGLAKPLGEPDPPSPPVALSEEDLSTSDTLAQSGPPGSDTLVEAYRSLGGGGVIYGSPGYMAPEQWRSLQHSEATDVWALGVTLYEMLTGTLPYSVSSLRGYAEAVCSPDPVPRIPSKGTTEIPEALQELVHGCLHKQVNQRLALTKVAEGLRLALGARRQASRSGAGEDGVGPFRGLLPFGEEHAAYFFGREAEVDAFVERLRGDHATIAVVGPSGAGKSSFVQAGVIPRLREQGRWTVLRLRPGATPFRTLAARLRGGDSAVSVTVPMPSPDAEGEQDEELGKTRPPQTDEDRLVEQLMESPARLGLQLRQLVGPAGGKVLLFVDQLEELFTQVESSFVRRRFMEALATAADDPEEPIRVIVALRDDFLGRVAEGPEARAALEQVVVLQRPGREVLEDVLVRPLEEAGFRYEDEELVEEMVQSVGEEPTGLPLLQFAARMLWERRDRDRRLLLRSVYDELGGVPGALASHADHVLDGLSPAQLAMAAQILLRLVTAEGTRRTLSRVAVLEGLGEGAGDVLDRLVTHRLLAVRRGPDGSGEAWLELAHESLIVNWTRLSRWLEESQEERIFLAEAGQAAELWRRRGRRDQEVWQGDALHDALRSLARCRTSVPREVERFLAAGKQRERRGRRLRAAGLMLGVAVVVAAVTVWVLTLSKKEDYARMQSSLAQLESAKVQWGVGRFDEARAWLRGSLEIQDSREARRLWWKLSRQPQLWVHDFGDAIDAASVAADSRLAAVAVRDGPVYLLDLERHTARPFKATKIGALAFSPDGARLATGGVNGEVRVWDLTTGSSRLIHRYPIRSKGKVPVREIRFDADGRAVLSRVGNEVRRDWLAGDVPPESFKTDNIGALASRRGLLFFAGFQDHRIYRGVGGISTQVEGVPLAATPATFSLDGRLLAVGGFRHNEVQLYDADTARRIARLPVQHKVFGVALSSDNKLLAMAISDGTVEVWDVARQAVLQRSDVVHRRPATVAFAPNRRVLLSGGFGGKLIVWKVDAARRDVPTGHTASVTGLTFLPDGRLLSSGAEGALVFWDLDRQYNRVRPTGHTGGIYNHAVSPDGKLLATAGVDGVIGLWETSNGRWIRRLVGHDKTVVDVAFSPDGTLLASAGNDRVVRVWSTKTGQEERRLPQPRKVATVSFHPDGKLLAVAGNLNRVRVYELSSGKVRWNSPRLDPTLRARFTPSGTLIIRTPYGALQEHYPGSNRPFRFMWHGFDMFGRLLMSGRYIVRGAKNAYCPMCSVKLIDSQRKTGRRLWGHRTAISNAAIGADLDRVATASGKSIRLWRLSDGAPLWRVPFMDTTPPRLFTHRGVIDLRTGKEIPIERALRHDWERAVWERAKLARSRGRTVCIQAYRDRLELWDRQTDRRLLERQQSRVTEILATNDGCVVQTDAGVVLHRAGARPRTLAKKNVRGLSIHRDTILFVEDQRLSALSFAGDRIRQRKLPKHVSAVHRVQGGYYVGFPAGMVFLIPDEAKDFTPHNEIPDTRKVKRIVSGVADTLIVTRGDGTINIYDRRNRREWLTDRLNGPIVHVALVGNWLYVATEVNDWRTYDLSVLTKPHCELVREVWRSVPEVLAEGSPEPRLESRPPDPTHRCFKAQ